ncbi:hypothetical protein CERSUDRAFT_70635 [Gelatoporia subvermispora B]|uniref:Methyltransferase type 11 domain-containing protein n=1 Tax=Ceriporiopsis subvermispora (strain B) TaxID=914234 RepID=M2PZC8_CERS8|nr:hypothetical protein CERSUDRAFT_70635 [Gelatoporia subvermispora B]
MAPKHHTKTAERHIPELENVPCYDIETYQAGASPSDIKEHADTLLPRLGKAISMKKFPLSRKNSNQPVSAGSSKDKSEEDAESSTSSDEEESEPVWINPIPTERIQTYDHYARANDRRTNDLYAELVKEGQATFYDFEDTVPSRVLSIGRSDGYWVSRAATMWPSTMCKQIFHTDVVEPCYWSLDTHVKPMKKGDFFKVHSIYPDNYFDFIRIANINLQIRDEEWDQFLGEVYRVLSPGGIVEIIDDILFFPSILPSRHRSRGPMPPRIIQLKTVRNTTFEDDGSDSASPRSSLDSVETSLRRTPSNRRHNVELCHPAIDLEAVAHSSHVLDTAMAKELEFVFEEMLRQRFRVTPGSSTVIEDAIHRTFGSSSISIYECHLSVPPREFFEEAGDRTGASGRRPSTKRSNTFGQFIRKATDVLRGHGEYESPYWQPPGLMYQWRHDGELVSQPQLLKLSPEDLEWHAARNIQILLECQDAMKKWIEEFVAAGKTPPIPEKTLAHYFSDYEQFKRRRFNWPSVWLDFFDEESKPNLLRRLSDANGPAQPALASGQGSVEVRTIRIFHVTKPSGYFVDSPTTS